MNILDRSAERIRDKILSSNLSEVRSLMGSRSDRAYHNISHVAYMLEPFENFVLPRLSGEEARLVEIAIWFHDAVYDPQAKDNEERSADLAASSVTSDIDVARLRHMILCTKTHRADTMADQYLIDLDLLILAADPSRYQAYAAAVREEYSFVPEALYRDQEKGRPAVLRLFLDRETLCPLLSQAMFEDRNVLRDRARDNIERELETLK